MLLLLLLVITLVYPYRHQYFVIIVAISTGTKQCKIIRLLLSSFLCVLVLRSALFFGLQDILPPLQKPGLATAHMCIYIQCICRWWYYLTLAPTVRGNAVPGVQISTSLRVQNTSTQKSNIPKIQKSKNPEIPKSKNPEIPKSKNPKIKRSKTSKKSKNP